MSKIVATIEARMGATRLPGKMALEVSPGLTALGAVIERVQRCTAVDDVVVATTTEVRDDQIVHIAHRHGVRCFRGSETDVLGRVVGAAVFADADTVVPLCGDCTCVSPRVIAVAVSEFRANPCDCLVHGPEQTYPNGIEVPVVRRDALERAHAQVLEEPYCRDENNVEHTTYFLLHHPEQFAIRYYGAPPSHRRPDLTVLLDTPEDLAFMRAIYGYYYATTPHFDLDDLLRFADAYPDVFAAAQQPSVNRVGYTV